MLTSLSSKLAASTARPEQFKVCSCGTGKRFPKSKQRDKPKALRLVRPSATRDETENYEPSFVGLPARGNRSEKPLFRARSTRQARSLRLGTKWWRALKSDTKKEKNKCFFLFSAGALFAKALQAPFPRAPLGRIILFVSDIVRAFANKARSGDNSSRKKADRINLHKPIYRIKSGLPCLSALPIIMTL